MGRTTSQGPPPNPDDTLALAVSQFNSWRFWDCHETLEEIWRREGGQAAHFYKGLIKAAAGLHHLLRKNDRGASIVLQGAIDALTPFRPHHLGLDVEGLVCGLEKCLEMATGRQPLDLSLIPHIRRADAGPA